MASGSTSKPKRDESFSTVDAACTGESTHLCAARAGHSATLLDDDNVLLVGGQPITELYRQGGGVPLYLYDRGAFARRDASAQGSGLAAKARPATGRSEEWSSMGATPGQNPAYRPARARESG